MKNNWSEPLIKMALAHRMAGLHACSGEWEPAKANLMLCARLAVEAIEAMTVEERRREVLEASK